MIAYLKNIAAIFAIILLSVPLLHAQQRSGLGDYKLIAHRGGVVDSTTAENSIQALEKAVSAGYDRIEIDVRISRDSVFIVHHDRNFNRYYNVDSPVDSLSWSNIRTLQGTLCNRVHTLDEILSAASGRIKVMVDLKIPGNDTALHGRLVAALARYDLLDNAMMIGTEASTDFYRGKIALSCTRQQLEENVRRPGFHPSHYYLFSDKISAEDVQWATHRGIPVVGVINAWAQRGDKIQAGKLAAKGLLAVGVHTFQIDSMFDVFFR